MRGLVLFLLLLVSIIPTLGQDTVSYICNINLPIDLYTGDGMILEKGRHNLELHIGEQQQSLSFLKHDQTIATVKGNPYLQRERDRGLIPLVGTLLLRSTLAKIGTDEERHYSKTGRAQYEYEHHNWDATLRVYRSVNSETKEVRFVFHNIGESGYRTQVDFLLFLNN